MAPPYTGKIKNPPSGWMAKFLSQSALTNLFTDYLSLPCYVVIPKDFSLWYTLVSPSPEAHPYHFEVYYGKKEERGRYNRRCLKQAFETQKSVLGLREGLYDLFVPVLQKGKVQACLVTGSFTRDLPTRDGLTRSFISLVGRQPQPTDPAFLEYAKTVLKAPLLTREPLDALEHLLHLAGRILMGEGDGLSLEVERLRDEVFASFLPNRMWRYVDIKADRLLWGFWQGQELAPWDRKEFRLSRHPNTVLAAVLSDGEGLGEIDNLVETVKAQWAAFDIVREIPETICGRMGVDGLVFLTSPDPSRSSAQAKLQVRDLCLTLEKRLRKELKRSFAFGVSHVGLPWKDLPEGFQQAVMALHLGVHQKASQVFYQDQFAGSKGGLTPAFWAQNLTKAAQRGVEKEVKLAREQFVKEVLRHSGQKREVLRAHFLNLLFQLLERVKERGLLEPRQLEELSGDLAGKYENAGTVGEFMGLFQTHLFFFLGLFKAPVRGEKAYRMEQAKRYIDVNFHETLSMGEMARRTGFSLSHFSRQFHRAFGMGYADYLNQKRLDQARKLLESTTLPVAQVGEQAGFALPSYFIHRFKKAFGLPPSAYRQKQAKQRQ